MSPLQLTYYILHYNILALQLKHSGPNNQVYEKTNKIHKNKREHAKIMHLSYIELYHV